MALRQTQPMTILQNHKPIDRGGGGFPETQVTAQPVEQEDFFEDVEVNETVIEDLKEKMEEIKDCAHLLSDEEAEKEAEDWACYYASRLGDQERTELVLKKAFSLMSRPRPEVRDGQPEPSWVRYAQEVATKERPITEAAALVAIRYEASVVRKTMGGKSLSGFNSAEPVSRPGSVSVARPILSVMRSVSVTPGSAEDRPRTAGGAVTGHPGWWHVGITPLDRVAGYDAMRRQSHNFADKATRYIAVDLNDNVRYIGEWNAVLLNGSSSSRIAAWFLRSTQQRREWAALFRGETIPRGESDEGLRTAMFFMTAMLIEGALIDPDPALAKPIEAMCDRAADEVCGRTGVTKNEVNAFLTDLNRTGNPHGGAAAAPPEPTRIRPVFNRHKGPQASRGSATGARRDENRCFGCGELGHRRRQCPKGR